MHFSAKKLETKHLKSFCDINSKNDYDIRSFLISKRKFTSEFDKKGAKKFLSEKEIALEKIILDDQIQKIKEDASKDKKKKDIVNKNRRRLQSLNIKSKKKKIKQDIYHFPTFGEDENQDKHTFAC
jgi:hypothetical protein